MSNLAAGVTDQGAESIIAFYMDVHIPRAITVGLRLRGVDVITSQEDNTAEMADADLLDRATALQRVLFTCDDDLLNEANKRQYEAAPFAGVIYIHQLNISIGRCINDLEIIAKAGQRKDLINRVQFLPL
jgi:predicted nuclease of predicted toxin-antitoxin system